MAMGSAGELMETAIRRKPALALLAEGPHHRRELEEELGVSKATCHRIIRAFDEEGLLRRTNDGYELTEFGRVVNEQVQQVEDTVRSARQLESLLEGVAASDVEFDIELFAHANVVRARSNDPYPPHGRFMELFRESKTLRNIGPTPVPPTMAEEIFDLLFSEGKKIELIKPKPILRKYVSEYADEGRKAAGRDQLGARIYDGFQFGMSLFDDHVGLRGYDLETGKILVFADTDDREAVAWGEDVFDHFRERASPLSQFDEFPEWAQDGLELGII